MRIVFALIALAFLTAMPARAAAPAHVEIEFLLCEDVPAPGLEKKTNGAQTVYVGREPRLTNDDIDRASAETDPQSGTPIVRIVFTANGAKRFADLTTSQTGRLIAIVADGKLLSAPKIMEPILGGEAIITGNFTMAEAKAIADGIVPPYGDLTFELRNAELDPAAGLTEWRDGDRTIYVGTDIVLTNADIASLHFLTDSEEATSYVEAVLTKDAAARILNWSGDGHPTLGAVFLDGQISFVFGLDSPIDNGAVIVATNITPSQADRIMRGLTPPPQP